MWRQIAYVPICVYASLTFATTKICYHNTLILFNIFQPLRNTFFICISNDIDKGFVIYNDTTCMMDYIHTN